MKIWTQLNLRLHHLLTDLQMPRSLTQSKWHRPKKCLGSIWLKIQPQILQQSSGFLQIWAHCWARGPHLSHTSHLCLIADDSRRTCSPKTSSTYSNNSSDWASRYSFSRKHRWEACPSTPKLTLTANPNQRWYHRHIWILFIKGSRYLLCKKNYLPFKN